MRGAIQDRANPVRRSIPLAQWPLADRVAWTEALAPGDILEPGGPASLWRPATVKEFQRIYGRYLGFLTRAGWLDPAVGPSARFTPEIVAPFVEELRWLNAPCTVVSQIASLYSIIHALNPVGDYAWLKRISLNLATRAVARRNKAVLVVGSDELVGLGIQIMADAAREGDPIEIAVRRQSGLMIALLALIPLRKSNFASIEIGRHLRTIGEMAFLVFPGTEMKNHEPLRAPVPPELMPALRRHLEVDRPVLAAVTSKLSRRRPPGDALWLSRCGSALHKATIYNLITDLTRAHFGHAIHPHLFRDCAATTIAEEDAAHVGIIPAVLGHTCDETSARHYNHACGYEAARRHQQVLSALRGAREGSSKCPATGRACYENLDLLNQ